MGWHPGSPGAPQKLRGPFAGRRPWLEDPCFSPHPVAKLEAELIPCQDVFLILEEKEDEGLLRGVPAGPRGGGSSLPPACGSVGRTMDLP